MPLGTSQVYFCFIVHLQTNVDTLDCGEGGSIALGAPWVDGSLVAEGVPLKSALELIGDPD